MLHQKYSLGNPSPKPRQSSFLAFILLDFISITYCQIIIFYLYLNEILCISATPVLFTRIFLIGFYLYLLLFKLMHLSTLTPVLFPSIYLYGFYPFLSHLSSDLYLNEIRKTTPVLLPTIYLDWFYLIFQHLFENSLVVEKIYASPFSTHLSYLAFSFSLSSISLSFQLMFAKPFLASQDALEVMRVTD